jgi:hypothetical protein
MEILNWLMENPLDFGLGCLLIAIVLHVALAKKWIE